MQYAPYDRHRVGEVSRFGNSATLANVIGRARGLEGALAYSLLRMLEDTGSSERRVVTWTPTSDGKGRRR